MLNALLVMVGGAVGALLRYALSRVLPPVSGWPVATFCANAAGGFAMGLLAGYVMGRPELERLRLLIGVGVLGGFTTFSAFSLETVGMIEARHYSQAGLYATGSVVASVAGTLAGLWLMRRGLA